MSDRDLAQRGDLARASGPPGQFFLGQLTHAAVTQHVLECRANHAGGGAVRAREFLGSNF